MNIKSKIIYVVLCFVILLCGCDSKAKNKTEIIKYDYEVTDDNVKGVGRRFEVIFDAPKTEDFECSICGLKPGFYYMIMECSNVGDGEFAISYASTKSLASVDTEEKIDLLLQKNDDLSDGERIHTGNAITSIPKSKTEKDVTVRGIEVGKDGVLYVGLLSEGMKSGQVSVSGFRIIMETNQDEQYQLLLGGALSRLNYVEDTGAIFYDKSGEKRNPLDVMKESGINFCRLELYNNPGKGRGDGRYYCPDGYQNLEDIIDIARRAKNAGMEIQLSFMLSDFWTYGIPDDFVNDIEKEIDASITYNPTDGFMIVNKESNEYNINNISQTEEGNNTKQISEDSEYYRKIIDILEQDTYDWIYDSLKTMQDEDVLPKYISIGNEMNGGFYLPYGDSTKHMDNLTRFINTGYKAVKEVSEDIQVVLHIGCNADDMKWEGNGTGTWFFSKCDEAGVDYDVIGTSYYPFWGETTSVDDLVKWCNLMINQFDKDILIMETGFNFAKETETGSYGQLSDMGIYEGVYDYSPKGQRDFMIELINGIKSVKDGRCIGDLYWDPIMVAGPGIGWSFKESSDTADKNVISNTTWFDFEHKALDVFDAYKYN